MLNIRKEILNIKGLVKIKNVNFVVIQIQSNLNSLSSWVKNLCRIKTPPGVNTARGPTPCAGGWRV